MIRTLIVAASLFSASSALAETTVDPHAGHQMTGAETPATMAFMQANAAMHEGMAIAFTGDADIDFIRGMIPHHQGAVDMAKIVLQYGADPEIKKMAQEILAAQEKEIAMFRAWLAKRQK
jgi:uncharacterized protein (DUF305 family)